MSLPLFDPALRSSFLARHVKLSEGAALLRGFALRYEETLIEALREIATRSPFRFMRTPSGKAMRVALTSCGELGWISDHAGYRYSAIDPVTQRPWPAMPPALASLATEAAAEAGFRDFAPNTCLINHYRPATGLALHQDLDEGNAQAPIVSISLGIPATFLFGGFERSASSEKIALEHGDIIVFGGPDRLRFHGIRPLRYAEHPLLGARRFNLSLRVAAPARLERCSRTT